MSADAAPLSLDLPVDRQADELLDAIRHNQVVVVEGATGSGKTTQIPRILLHAGLTDRVIGVTQPRRIAATSVAHRIATLEGAAIGGLVGHCIRFDDKTSDATRIKVMTDGILLEEARTDRDFEQYGVLMIDEAHERTLNIDVTLGLLARALRRRADLRVVVSSATLDPERFVEFFGRHGQRVPSVHIDARPFPVDIRYRPPALEHDRDERLYALCDEIERICRGRDPGHVLCFLTGEGPIQHTLMELRRRRLDKVCELLPLYGALLQEEQERVFDEFGRRKVVLSTNIAETSITVPDVRFVIDTGVAKVPRVDPRTGIRTLAEEPISRASCDQRSGRAGRTAPGVAIRLYHKRDYERRPEFADEEILRLDLREVVLRLIDLGIHDVEGFELPTPPSRHRLKSATEWLVGMGLIDSNRTLTARGRIVTPFPLTPPLGVMVAHAAEHYPEALDEVLLVAAFLSARRPFLFPVGQENEARAAQSAFQDPRGDVLTLLHLHAGWRAATDKERFCQRAYADPHILAFVAHAHEQLRDIARRVGLPVDAGAERAGHGKGNAEAVVRSFAAGFRDQILHNEGRHYSGVGGARVVVHPGSSCSGTEARFIVASEIIVLARTYASGVATLKPDWIASLDPELAERMNLRQRREEPKRAPRTTYPDAVEVGEVRLPIVERRGRVQVDIPYAALDALATLPPSAIRHVEPRLLSLKARVLSGEHAWAAGTPLGVLLRLLPSMPVPAPDADLDAKVPEGVLFESDRNLHGLLRHLGALLQPLKPQRGRPGWLALVANGAGGFWLEIMTSWPDAVEATALGIEALAGALDDSDPAVFEIEGEARRIEAIAEHVQRAKSERKRGRRG